MKTSEFNLLDAISGARLVTRIGYPVLIFTFSRRFSEYPIVGMIRYPSYDHVMTWTSNGRASKLNRPHDNDLMICLDEVPVDSIIPSSANNSHKMEL